jgi:hypothetical protein
LPVDLQLFSKFSFAIDGRKPNTDPAHMRLCYTFTTLSAFVTNYLLMRGILSVGVADGSGILVAAFIVLAQAAYDLNHSFWGTSFYLNKSAIIKSGVPKVKKLTVANSYCGPV